MCAALSRRGGQVLFAVVEVTTVFKSAADIDVDIESKEKAQRLAVKYISADKWNFPPDQGKFLGGKGGSFAERIALLKALADYAAALAELNDAALSKDATSAASALTLALSDFQSAHPVERGDKTNLPEIAAKLQAQDQAVRQLQVQQMQAEGAVIAEAVGVVVTAVQDAETRDMIRRMQPVIVEVSDILAKDAADISITTWVKADLLKTAIWKRLAVMQRDAQLSSAQKYDLYMAAVNENAGVQERAAIVSTLAPALKKLPTAHEALAEPDHQQALSEFLADAQTISAKVRALNEIEEKLRQARKL